MVHEKVWREPLTPHVAGPGWVQSNRPRGHFNGGKIGQTPKEGPTTPGAYFASKKGEPIQVQLAKGHFQGRQVQANSQGQRLGGGAKDKVGGA